MPILDKIDSPQDLRKLDIRSQMILADELRNEILNICSKKGGHLASNLGVVELTIAVHNVFNTPIDKVVWDVGHQTYAHKILTSRREAMTSLRDLGGLSGFPKRYESEYDTFDTGHSSTSISAALGLARARDLKGEKNRIIAIIGDGALTGGMAFEALADAGSSKSDIIVILNDNEMSIEKNNGGMAIALSKARTKPLYTNSNRIIKKAVLRVPCVGEYVVKGVRRIKHTLKQLLIPDMIFEDMGFTYLGPVDGHDLEKLEAMLYRARDLKGPVLIHCLTKKGKGYKPAEENPDLYHGVSPFSLNEGIALKEDDDYSYIFGKKLTELAKKDNRIVAITAAMASGTGLSLFKETFPDRFFDVEIAEQHAMTMAAGLALGGMIPVISIYSSFAQRAYDQLIHDVALQNAHVVICFDRAGLVGRDGETHQGLYDLAFSKLIPNLTIMAPKDYGELEAMLESAIYDIDGPVIIRYPRGSESLSYGPTDREQIGKRKAEIIRNGDDVTLIAIGKMVAYADKAAKILEDKGIRAKVINVRFFKPLDKETILDNLSERVCTLEDGTLCGGLAEVIDSLIVENSLSKAVLHFGYPDRFIAQGSVEELEKVYGLTQEDIARKIFKTWFE